MQRCCSTLFNLPDYKSGAMKKDTIEQLAKNIENLRRKVIKAKSEEEIKEKFTKKNNWKQFRINVNRSK